MNASVAAIRVHMGYSPEECRYLALYAERYNLPLLLAEARGAPVVTEIEALARVAELWRQERGISRTADGNGLSAHTGQRANVRK